MSRLISVVERPVVSKCLLKFSTGPILGLGIEDGLSLGGIRLSRNLNWSPDRQGSLLLKPIFHLATLFARREAKTRIRLRDWLKLACEKIRREQVGIIPTFLPVRTNKFAKWKIGLSLSTEATMAEPTIGAQSTLMLPFPSWSCEGRRE